MEFVVVVVGLMILHIVGALSAIQKDTWYEQLVATLNRRLLSLGLPLGGIILSLALPVLAVVLLNMTLVGKLFWLPWFVFNLVVLLYAFGRGDLDQQVGTYLVAVEREDLQAAYHDSAEFNINHSETAAENLLQLEKETLKSIPYRYFERCFAVIFWYAVCGVGGALLYRLSVMHDAYGLGEEGLGEEGLGEDGLDEGGLDEDRLDEEKGPLIATRWLWLMEWLPLRLTGLTLALAGNFAQCFRRWRGLLLEKEKDTAQILECYVEGALALEPDAERENKADFHCHAANIRSMRDLFNRALICVVCGLALLVLVR